MSFTQIIIIILLLASGALSAHFFRINVTPTANAAIFLVTDRWTGSVYYCAVGNSSCFRNFPGQN